MKSTEPSSVYFTGAWDSFLEKVAHTAIKRMHESRGIEVSVSLGEGEVGILV